MPTATRVQTPSPSSTTTHSDGASSRPVTMSPAASLPSTPAPTPGSDSSSGVTKIQAEGVNLHYGPKHAESGPAYIHFRLFSTGTDDPIRLHSIHTEEKELPGGGSSYRAVFTKDDPLEWFET